MSQQAFLTMYLYRNLDRIFGMYVPCHQMPIGDVNLINFCFYGINYSTHKSVDILSALSLIIWSDSIT